MRAFFLFPLLYILAATTISAEVWFSYNANASTWDTTSTSWTNIDTNQLTPWPNNPVDDAIFFGRGREIEVADGIVAENLIFGLTSSGYFTLKNGDITLGEMAYIEVESPTVIESEIKGADFLLVKSGSSPLYLSGTSTYSGATFVEEGALIVHGNLVNTYAVTVSSGATIGGSGTIGGDLNLRSGANFAIENTHNPLGVGGDVYFDNFDFSNLIGWDYAHAESGEYDILNSYHIHTENIQHYGIDNALSLPDDRIAFFDYDGVHLHAIISPRELAIPEPSTTLLFSLSLLPLLRRHRRQQRCMVPHSSMHN